MQVDTNVLKNMIRSKSSFMLYGPKASGKTTTIHQVLRETHTLFIEINCTLIFKRNNFLQLFNVQLDHLLKEHKIQYSKPSQPINLDSWINQIRKLVFGRDDLVDFMNGIYVLMDNIEELSIQQDFITAFYNACQMEFQFKLNFIFCGINFKHKEIMLHQPFRNLPSFCMPKPVQKFNQIIQKTVQEYMHQTFRSKLTADMIEKLCKSLSTQIRAAFENIESNLQKMKPITRGILQCVVPQLGDDQPLKSLSRMINRNELKDILQKASEHGPLQDDVMKRKLVPVKEDESFEANNLEYYPNLILTSIYLADFYPEKDDKRRFQDYKGKSSSRNKELKRSEFKMGKHQVNRIIAIAQALESQAGKENDKERKLSHHSLDFYALFEHLKSIGRIRFTGGKIAGIVKEQQTKAFMSKCDLKYEQFMSN